MDIGVTHPGYLTASTRVVLIACCVLVSGSGAVNLLRRSVLDYFCVVGESMKPTLLEGDCILVPKGSFARNNILPDRGSIIVLRLASHGSGYLVKRVIAQSGDTVEVRNGRLSLNGKFLVENYLNPSDRSEGTAPPHDWHFAFLTDAAQQQSYIPTSLFWGPLVVPESSLFVLGDNRTSSGDSRNFGFVHPREVIGEPIMTFLDDRRRPLLISILLHVRFVLIGQEYRIWRASGDGALRNSKWLSSRELRSSRPTCSMCSAANGRNAIHTHFSRGKRPSGARQI